MRVIQRYNKKFIRGDKLHTLKEKKEKEEKEKKTNKAESFPLN